MAAVALFNIAAAALPGIALAQHDAKPAPELGIIYSAERAQSAATSGNHFWLQGAGADLAVPVYKGFSVAGSFSGGHAGNIGLGVKLNKITYVIGPRYTVDLHHAWGAQLFGQALFGGAHGFQSLFPTNGGLQLSQTSFAMQLGGGIDIPARSWAGWRPLQVDYVYTRLPNGGNNTQNDLRIGFGGYFRFGGR